MTKNKNQLEFDFNGRDLVLSGRFECDHTFRTDDFTCHEVCDACGLVVPHEYIIDNLDIKDWGHDEL